MPKRIRPLPDPSPIPVTYGGPDVSKDPGPPVDPGPQVTSIHMAVIGEYGAFLDLPKVYSWGYDEDRVLTIVAASADDNANERVQHVIQPGEWSRVEVKMTYDRDLT